MLKIGPYQFEHNIVLAPMAGITDAAFREICRQNGASYTLSEMVASKKQLWESKKSSTRHVNQNDPEPRAIQLIGTNALELAEAASWQASQGAQIIDINMGCPAKKVCSVAAGSALMSNPSQVESILKTVVNAVDVPVTLKIRTGPDDDNKNAKQIALIAEQQGVQALTIHGRTRTAKFSGKAEYDTIKEVKSAVNIPVIANGDICTPEEAEYVLKYTAADGIMIGRAAQGYPWIFREINHYLSCGKKLSPPSLSEFQSTMLSHLAGLHLLYGETHGVRIARKHLGWYAQHLPNGDVLRKEFNQLTLANEQLNKVKQYFIASQYFEKKAI